MKFTDYLFEEVKEIWDDYATALQQLKVWRQVFVVVFWLMPNAKPLSYL